MYISRRIVKDLNIEVINNIIRILKSYKNKSNILEFKVLKNRLFYNKEQILKLNYSFKKEKGILAIRKEDREIGRYWDIKLEEEFKEK